MSGDIVRDIRFHPPGSSGDLHQRIGRIATLARGASLAALVGEVHSLKLAARAWRFDLVEALAHSLEADLAATGRSTIVMTYVERMAEAVDCDDISPAAKTAMVASVRARMLY
jgi:hypothetical protein